jgi:hypothetical protein
VGQEGRSEFDIDLDELVCEGARRMLAVALEEEVAAYIAAHAGEVVSVAIAWSGGMATPASAWLRLVLARCRWRRRGWTTAGSTRRAVSGSGSGR